VLAVEECFVVSARQRRELPLSGPLQRADSGRWRRDAIVVIWGKSMMGIRAPKLR
jgi:hypothetical protein